MRVHLYRGKPLRKEDYMLNENMQYSVGYFKDGFVYGSLIVKHDKYFICVGVAGVLLNSLVNNATATLIEVIPETVGEYTNLTDCHDKKIFEGDILNVINPDDDYDYITKVYFECNTLCVDVEGQDYDYTSIGFAVEIWDDECDRVEVIGNIYDNPELLEV